ncbi:hypothetical protein QZH41_020279 [Actinostola sp. cb2023]|nr:hypothetical protein QZH41_020279 [Actinostola sp. cb2023]
MNIKLLLALCLVTFLLLPDADAWGGRRRRRRFRIRIRVRRILKPICRAVCYVKGCSYVWANGVAQYVCRKTCKKNLPQTWKRRAIGPRDAGTG